MSDQPLSAPVPIGAQLKEAVVAAVDPDKTMAQVVKRPGLILGAIVLGTYVIVGTLMFLFGTKVVAQVFPGFTFTVRQFIALAIGGAGAAGAVFVGLNVLGKRTDVKIDQAANAVAVALVPYIALDLVVFILMVILPKIAPLFFRLQLMLPFGVLVIALMRGLDCSAKQSLWTTTLAAIVWLLIMGFVGVGMM